MNRERAGLVFLALSVVVSSPSNGETAAPRQAARQAASGRNEETPITLGLGGCGGVYLLAEPGELTVDVEKRDRNRRGRRTELRAILVGPDRKVLYRGNYTSFDGLNRYIAPAVKSLVAGGK